MLELDNFSVRFALAVSILGTPAKAEKECSVPRASGLASWYNVASSSTKTASGERFTGQDMTAAHKTLPFNSMVKVTDQQTGKSIVVRINDRGPYVAERVIDLSEAAAKRLGSKKRGTVPVKLKLEKCG